MHAPKIILFFLIFFTLHSVPAHAIETSQERKFQIEKKIDELLAKADKLKYDDNSHSISLLKEAERLVLKEKNERKLGEVYTTYGTLYYVNGTYDVSLQMHLKALKIHEKYKNYKLITRSLNGVGLVQMGLNQYEECISTFEKCAELNKKFKNFDALGRNYFNISVA